jgi:hypothetical protein
MRLGRAFIRKKGFDWVLTDGIAVRRGRGSVNLVYMRVAIGTHDNHSTT